MNREMTFTGEHIMHIIFFPISLTIFGLIWLSFFVQFQFFGKLILVIIALFVFRFLLMKSVLRVTFKENELYILQIHRTVKLKYTEIKKIQEHREFFFYNQILVYPKNKHKIRYYFYCPEHQKKELDDFLREKSLFILAQR